MPNLLSFIVNIVDSSEKVLIPSYAIKIANLLCTILCRKDHRHSALNKINSLHMMFNRSTVANLKIFQNKGNSCCHTEGNRLVEEIVELSEYYKSSKFTLGLGASYQFVQLGPSPNPKRNSWSN